MRRGGSVQRPTNERSLNCCSCFFSLVPIRRSGSLPGWSISPCGSFGLSGSSRSRSCASRIGRVTWFQLPTCAMSFVPVVGSAGTWGLRETCTRPAVDSSWAAFRPGPLDLVAGASGLCRSAAGSHLLSCLLMPTGHRLLTLPTGLPRGSGSLVLPSGPNCLPCHAVHPAGHACLLVMPDMVCDSGGVNFHCRFQTDTHTIDSCSSDRCRPPAGGL